MIRPFVNRVEEIRHLNQALKYNGQENPLLVFTGIGGIGKTAIRISFEEKLLKPKRIPYAVLDYDGDPNLRPIEATLRAIRRQLGRFGVKTPVFDYLYARYFELSTGLKFSSENYPPELENVVSILKGIPGFGSVTAILYGLSKLGLNVKERLQHKEWLYRIRELEPREVLNLLPEVLAEDLEEAMFSGSPKILKSSGFRISLFLDAYEHISESQLDDTLHRKLLLLTPHLLRVIFTRDPLPWEYKFPKEWKGKIKHFPPLEDLVYEDAIKLFEENNIENKELQEYLYQLTGGYPFHLELCADIYKGIKEATNKEPSITDYEGTDEAKNLTDELVNRLLRQLKDDERDLMGLASYPRWVSEEVLEVLSSVPESVSRIFQKFIKLSMFSPHQEIPEAYTIRKEVRECLIQQQRQKRFWKERHGKLAKIHRERWEETKSIHHLREAIYHGFFEDPGKAMKVFEENFWEFLEKFNFSEAEGILHAVPLEILNDKLRRRFDYALACFLTSSIYSQQSLITAKHIYKELIASKVNEDSLGKYFFAFGELMRIMGEYEKALEYNQKGLDKWLKIYGEEHPRLLKLYNNMGNIHYHLAEYSKALEYYQKSLDFRLKVFGKEHPDVAESQINIGNIYDEQGDHEKALEYYQRSLTTRLDVYGEEHPDVATSYNNIGGVYWEYGDYDKALEYFQKSLNIRLKIYGKEHPDVAQSHNNIGAVYYNQTEYEKALEYFEKSFNIRLKVYGEVHPDVAISYNNIGEVYCAQSKYKKGIEYYNKSLDIFFKVYGVNHPLIAYVYKNIAHTLWSLKKEKDSFENIEKSIEIYKKFKLSKKVADCLEIIAGWLEEKGKSEEAKKTRKEAQKIRNKLLTKENTE